jgi:uncharacterized RDD family membrane protein YckC
MGELEGVTRSVSVAPPGWAPTGTPAEPVGGSPGLAPPATRSDEADAAVRWRINAAIIDNLLVYFAYLAICAVLHWRVADLNHLLVLLVGSVAYHFALEARDGQTIGKRQYGLRVLSADGQRASPGAVAIRSALRIFDQLPVMYVSGLVSMVRTGPSRRQRIGDVAAGTIVIATEGRSLGRGTPGWMLPVATIFAVVVSAASVYVTLEAGSQPLSSAQTAQLVAGCDRTVAAAVVNCQCFVTQLEAEGYVTVDALRSLVVQAQAEQRAGRAGSSSRTLAAAVLDCRR